jgi:hypothetical protein
MSRPDSRSVIRAKKPIRGKLKPKLDKTLLAYAAAASAAGVSVLALVEPSPAEVVFTPTHKAITADHVLPLDLNNDGIPDFMFRDPFLSAPIPQTCGGSSCFRYSGNLQVRGRRSNQVEGVNPFGLRMAKALPANSQVGPSAPFLSAGGTALMRSCLDSNDTYGGRGYWINSRNQFLGLKFMIDGQTHYGWARLSTGVDKICKLKALLTGYAYETEPDTPILTGKISSDATGVEQATPDDVMLEPASLGRLGQGTEGLAAWRTKRGAKPGN